VVGAGGSPPPRLPPQRASNRQALESPVAQDACDDGWRTITRKKKKKKPPPPVKHGGKVPADLLVLDLMKDLR
jgi:hypothetical protein